jgi:hypothetical protein
MSTVTRGEWDSCPQGELTRLAAELTFRRRLRIAAMAGLVVLAATGVTGAGWLAHSALRDNSPPPECAPCHSTDTPCELPTK